jgi:hypothetical protein
VARVSIADRVCDRMVGLIAATLLALSFLHVRDSHFGVTDVTATCFALAALVFLIRFDRTQALSRLDRDRDRGGPGHVDQVQRGVGRYSGALGGSVA